MTAPFFRFPSTAHFRVPVGVPLRDDKVLTEHQLIDLLGTSRVGHEPMEGLVARVQDSAAGPQRAKIVRPDFVQQIDQHWMAGAQSLNRLAAA
ncbi:MAG: hypothetical protein Q4F67_16465 [Propionibacteriaceae bacterium]|nr:hypothetical protein [Propionibacteriaceae bacterium]